MKGLFMGKFRIIALSAIMIFLFLPGAARLQADSEVPPYPQVITSKNGHYYFEIVLDKADPYDRDRGSGICYEKTGGQQDRVMWSTPGWYAFAGH